MVKKKRQTKPVTRMHRDKSDLWLEDKKWNDVIEIIAEQFEGVNIKWTWPDGTKRWQNTSPAFLTSYRQSLLEGLDGGGVPLTVDG